MYCKYCGTEYTAQQKFCTVCGKALQEKKKKSAKTIVLSCFVGLFAASTAVLGFLMPCQYQAGCADGYKQGYDEGKTAGYEAGYTEGIAEYDEGYALGWAQKQAVIDADIAQTPEYKSWAKAYPELGNEEIDSEIKTIYNELHASINNWYNMWEEGAYERLASHGSNHVNGADFNRYWFLKKALPYSVEALHNVVDNMMKLENDHVKANGIFWSAYNNIETALEESGYFPTYATRYEEWSAMLPGGNADGTEK